MKSILLCLTGLICRLVGLFGDRARAAFGSWLVKFINGRKIATIPSSAIFDPATQLKTLQDIKTAFDALTPDGKRGGWDAVQELILNQRKQAEPLLSLPRELIVTIMMGMAGDFTPRSSAAATAKIEEITKQYHMSGEPDFLYKQVIAETVKLLIAADTQKGVGTGCLKKLFEARMNPDREFGEKVREQAVLMAMQYNPELQKFLGKTEQGHYTLPVGNTYESFAASMLFNAYGDFKQGPVNER